MRGRQIGKPIFQILINVPSMFLGFKRNGKNQKQRFTKPELPTNRMKLAVSKAIMTHSRTYLVKFYITGEVFIKKILRSC